MSSNDTKLILYSYFRSSCSARLRIALNLKDLPYTSTYINLLKGEQRSQMYSALNPSGLVPTLQHVKASRSVTLTQSMAILEYLEQEFAQRYPLLPPSSDPVRLAEVRALANVVACDIQPVTNLQILSKVENLGGDKGKWARDLMTDGLAAYESLASRSSGVYSVGDCVTLADVCLVPAVWSALRFGVDLDAFPVVKRVYEKMGELPAVKNAHWQRQEDTPEDLQ